MIGKDYAWLMIGWYRDGWYMDEDFIANDTFLAKHKCTREVLKEAVESSNYIATESVFIRPNNVATVSGKVRIMIPLSAIV